MTGLEPHPIIRLPTQEEARAMGPAAFEALRAERARRLDLERDDPFANGHESRIWHLVDDLLVDGNKVMLVSPGRVDPPKEIRGAPEIWLAGSNRSSKSEYAAKKIMKVLLGTEMARTWSFADTGPVSVGRQQPILYKYLPVEVKRAMRDTGKAKQGAILNVSWGQKGGFTQETFVLPNGSQHWFKNYAQDIENVEGDQLDAVWFDELRNVELLKTVRGRMGDRGGIIIVTFTSIDENYSPVVNEYEKGARTVLEVAAELLPEKGPDGKLNGCLEKVPRVKVAGPGSDGNQRANIVYFHITDNPYYGYEAALKEWKKTGRVQLFGKERFYRLYRKATRSKILSRVYGILGGTSRVQFPDFNDAIHVIEPKFIPKIGSNYQIVDPCDGRNWFMIWIRIDARGRWFVYREWPTTSTTDWANTDAYIPGHGDIGPWTVPGRSENGRKPPADGTRGPAQSPLGFGTRRYMHEILRVEGKGEEGQRSEVRGQRSEEVDLATLLRRKGVPVNPLEGKRLTSNVKRSTSNGREAEVIVDRYMDSRYGATPTHTTEGQTTLLEQMGELGMEFLAASGKDIVEGIDLIRDKLEYDKETPIGEFSATLARMNEPRLFISRNCPNTIYALREWTNLDKQHGACKDPIDVLRYACLADIDYVSEEMYQWRVPSTLSL